MACPSCTFRNEAYVVSCDVCGADLPNTVAASGGSSRVKAALELLGTGEEGLPAVGCLRESLSLCVSVPRVDGKVKAWIHSPASSIRLGSKQLLPAASKLVFTDAVVAVVVHTGADCFRHLQGGAIGHTIRKRRRIIAEVVSIIAAMKCFCIYIAFVRCRVSGI